MKRIVPNDPSVAPKAKSSTEAPAPAPKSAPKATGIPSDADIEALRDALVARGLADTSRPSGAAPEADGQGLYQIRSVQSLPRPPASISFVQPLSPAQANAFLTAFRYDAVVDGDGRLDVGGRKLAIDPPNLQTLMVTLARHGVRAGRNDAALAEVSRLLEAGRTDRTWTEGDHDATTPHDFLEPRSLGVAKTAVNPEFLGAPFDLTAVVIPADRVAIDTATYGVDKRDKKEGRSLPPELQAYAEQVVQSFDNGDGTFTFPVHNQQLDAVYPEAKGREVRTLPAQPTSSDRTMAMGEVRLKMDLGQIQSVNSTKPLTRADATHDMQMWAYCQGLIDGNANLSLYCATQPEVVAFTDTATDITNLGRSIAPYPPHAQQPEGTLAVSLKSLLTEQGDEPRMLQTVIENRADPSQDPLDAFAESFIRPLMKTFRHLLDDHGIALFNLHEKNLSFETSLELGATGRMVLNDFGDVYPDQNLMEARGEKKKAAEIGLDTLAPGILPLLDDPRSLLHYGVNTLYDSLGAMATGFEECRFEGRAYTPDQIRGAVERVVSEELRYLRPDTAAYLGRDHKLKAFVHHIPEQQQATLTSVLDQVTQRARDRRDDPSLPAATVVVDLDLCGLSPHARAEEALSRVGDRFGIPELTDAEALPSLPAYHAEGFERFLDDAGLRAQHPDVDWAAVHAAYEDAFFSKELLSRDHVTPGLADFVLRVDEEGGHVVFNTGRRDADRKATLDTLRRAGILNPQVRMMPNHSRLSVEDAKRENMRGMPGEVVAVFDDLAKNRASMGEVFPQATQVEVSLHGFVGEAPVEGHEARVQSFEWDARATAGKRGQNVEAVLSGARSVGDVGLRSLNLNRVARTQGVTMNDAEARALLDSMLGHADEYAQRMATKATKRAARAERAFDSDTEKLAFDLHQLLTGTIYMKGSWKNWPFRWTDLPLEERPEGWEDMTDPADQLMAQMEAGRPISFVLPSFPIKEDKDHMKALGHLPDLAEMGAFMRMRELNTAIQALGYAPGVKLTALMDGHHYRPAYGETPEMIDEYMAMLDQYAQLVGAEDVIELVDYDDLALERRGPEFMAKAAEVYETKRKAYVDAFSGLDVTEDPIGALNEACRRDPAIKGDIKVNDLGGDPGSKSVFKDLFMSNLFSVPVPTPEGVDPQVWAKDVLEGIFNVHDPDAAPELIEARKAVLKDSWRVTYEYLATIQKDRELKFSSFATDAIRATIHPKPDQFGLALLGDSVAHLTPWHGTAAISQNKKELSVDFAVSLQSQGFVPLHVPWLGRSDDMVTQRQPFAMIPVSFVQSGTLRPDIMRQIKLHK